jgi:hypothetical protein
MSHSAACGHWREDRTLVGLRSHGVPAPYAVHAIAERRDRTVCHVFDVFELTD